MGDQDHTNSRSSLLLITTDQQRWDTLGCYKNNSIETPNIDRLAECGLRFDRAYVTNPLCMPARASLLTGRYPSAHRVWDNGVPLSAAEPTLSGALAAAGYRTALIGKAHFLPHDEAAGPGSVESPPAWRDGRLDAWHGPYFGFEHAELTLSHHRGEGHYGAWLRERFPDVPGKLAAERGRRLQASAPECWVSGIPVEAHNATWIAERTCARLRACREDDYFIWCSFPDPHHPFAPPAPYAARYPPADMPLPLRGPADELADRPHQYLQWHTEGRKFEGTVRGIVPAYVTDARWQQIKAHYYGTITLIDDAIGRVLTTLDELGLRQRTAVVFASDHGELLGDHGLLFKGPFTYESLIRTPFIWTPPGFDNGASTDALVSQVDLAPTILDYAGLPPDAMPGVQGRSLRPLLEGAQRTWRDAVVVDFHSGDEPALVMKTLVTQRWKLTVYADGRRGELIDLQADPGEFHNLYGLAEFTDIQVQLERQLLRELLAQSDTLPARWSNA